MYFMCKTYRIVIVQCVIKENNCFSQTFLQHPHRHLLIVFVGVVVTVRCKEIVGYVIWELIG